MWQHRRSWSSRLSTRASPIVCHGNLYSSILSLSLSLTLTIARVSLSLSLIWHVVRAIIKYLSLSLSLSQARARVKRERESFVIRCELYTCCFLTKNQVRIVLLYMRANFYWEKLFFFFLSNRITKYDNEKKISTLNK